MQQFQHIDIHHTQKMLEQEDVVVVDIRDEQSFIVGHIQGAQHLTNDTLGQFIQQSDFDTPVIVVCYHGISSQQAAQYLIQQGFEQVYSMDGGFESWKKNLPFVSEQA